MYTGVGSAHFSSWFRCIARKSKADTPGQAVNFTQTVMRSLEKNDYRRMTWPRALPEYQAICFGFCKGRIFRLIHQFFIVVVLAHVWILR